VPLDTLIFDPAACGFPRPRIPLLPTGLDGITLRKAGRWAPAGHFRHFARGRYALREAYRLAGIGPGGALLAPAYHCRTMLDPALALGGDVLLYPLRPDLTPDLAALEALAENSPVPVRALLATHFFGIPRPFEALAAWCARRGITLVEDCSHAFVTEQHRPTGIGMHGQFVVSSPYKFLPGPDGGLLYARDTAQIADIHPAAPALKDELRGIAHMRSKAAEQRRGRAACDPARIDAEFAAIMQTPAPSARDMRESAGCSADYRPTEEGRSALRTSRWLYRHADIERVARRRRENYRRWAAATMNLPYCRPLFPELPAGCIPYMFPLLIDQPETRFQWLKHMGLPIWRWDSIAASNCPTALDYRLRLLHLPCHQSLDDRELEWMIAVIGKASAGTTQSSS
jgi:dTDP-4-amino-4,6-dideoxygalactose transaminase